MRDGQFSRLESEEMIPIPKESCGAAADRICRRPGRLDDSHGCFDW
jgi:hypothetical protein